MASVKVAPFFLPKQSQPQGKGTDLKQENEVLKKENTSLKKEVQTLKLQVSELKNNKRKADSSTAAPPAKKAKTPAQRKKLFEKWAKAAKRASSKHKITNPCGGESFKAEVKETIPWTPTDFESIFGAANGAKIQPRPDNKPTSQITIIRWSDFEGIKALFGDVELSESDYTVQIWRSRSFRKSFKADDAPSDLKSLEVEYNKSKQTLKLNFGMHTNYDY